MTITLFGGVVYLLFLKYKVQLVSTTTWAYRPAIHISVLRPIP